MKTLLIISTLLVSVSLSICDPSAYYGTSGENWKPTGPLPDWSYAGYAANEKPIPNPKVVATVTNFGAKGDGLTDDTKAIASAIYDAQDKKGAVYFPPGKYLVTRKLYITSSNVVLRGAGQNQTTLYFPKSIEDAEGLNSYGNISAYSFGQGFIEVYGDNNKQKLTTVTKTALRGDRRLYVGSTTYLKVGNWIRLWMQDPPTSGPYTGSLFKYLYDNKQDDVSDLLGKEDVIKFASRISELGNGYIVLERPLAYDVKLAWRPEIHSLTNSVQNVGIENMSLEFPLVTYVGHHLEKGYNGIYMYQAMNAWVRNVHIINCDIGIFFRRMDFATIQGVTISVTADRSGESRYQGHYGIKPKAGVK